MAHLLVGCALLLGAAVAQKRSAVHAAPGMPTGVVGVALRDAAIVAWQTPEARNDRAAVTYIITAVDTSNPRKLVTTVKADAPGAEVQGLTGNHCYWFRVRAANAAGESADSDPSEAVCLPPPPGADLAVTMSAPESADDGSEVTFTLTITNNGTADAPMVALEDNLVQTLSSFTTSQGVCQPTAGGMGLRCNLGALHNGETASVTVTVVMRSTNVSNTAIVKGLDFDGNALADPVADNNSAQATVHVTSSS